MITKMKKLREQGVSYNKIGKGLGLHPNTIRYWLIPSYRKKQRDKIKKRKSNNKRRMELGKKKKNKFIRILALEYIAKQVAVYKWGKKDVKILGISMRKHWIPYLKKYYYKGSRKLGL